MDLSYDDFKQWFNETYLKYKGEVVNVFCHEARVIEIDGEIAVYEKVRKDFSYTVPRAGYYNYNGYALFLSRVPHRIWKRGLSKDGYDLLNPFTLWFSFAYAPEFDKPTCQIILSDNQPKYSLNNIFHALLLPNIYSVALSPEVMISRSPSKKTNKHILWYKLKPVGTIDKETRLVNVMEPIYKQEIEDTLRA